MEESLELYESQLKQIKAALQVATDEQKPDLEQIEKDLEEIIQLTKASLITHDSSVEKNDKSQEEENTGIEQQTSLEDELNALEGVKCKVPFVYEWGGIGLHDAIILGSEADESGSVMVQVVFMHPTNKKMQPCPYYLEGNCKYSDEKCHYSHGYSVLLDQVQDFKEPDYHRITEGSTILAKYKDGLWYRACVEDIIKGTQFSVKFLHTNDVQLLDLHSVFPLDEEDSSSDSSDDDSGDIPIAPRTLDMTDSASSWQDGPSSFGHWEQHTRGIGGKLMAKMGYVHGSGLGKQGEGRIEPVEAVVFPPGRSLDRCMELREKAGSENLLSVEKRLERQKAKAEHRLRQLASVAERDNSVFDFINSKLAKKTQEGTKDASRQPQKVADLGRLSHQKLNVQSLRIGEDIRRVERDISHIKKTLQRQIDRGDTAAMSHVRSRLAEKEKELERLRSSDRSIAREQNERKSSSKLTIF